MKIAEAVLLLLDEDRVAIGAIHQANEALDGFGARFEAGYTWGLAFGANRPASGADR